MRIPLLVAIALLTSGSVVAGEAEWPGWLGPQRNGWVPGVKPPEKWTLWLDQQWQFGVGTGYGSPVVSNGRVYQHARQGEEEVLWCFELSGRRVWRRSMPMPFKIAGGGDFHGKGPKSSPAIADGRIFTMSITGVLTAWNAKDGRILWQHDDSERYRGRFRKPHPNWGATTSPLVADGMVIVHFGTDQEGRLVALDTKTGKEIWSHGKDGASYSSPLLAEFHGVRQVVEWNHEALIGVDLKTGKELWRHPFPHVGTNQNMPTPTIYAGYVIVGGENRGLHCLEPLKIDNDWTVSVNWSNRRLSLDMASTIANGDRLYGLTHHERGRLFCVDIKSGDLIWKGPAKAGQYATFLALPGYVLALMDHGRMHVFKADTPEFSRVLTTELSKQPTWAPPVMLPGGLLIKEREWLSYYTFDE